MIDDAVNLLLVFQSNLDNFPKFLYVLKSPFLHSVENWIKCDNIILLQQGATIQ